MRYLWFVVGLVCGVWALDLPVEYDPFIGAKKIIKEHPQKKIAPIKPKRALHLEAIFDQKAMINGRFFSVGERVDGYRLALIGSNFVVLKKRNRKKVLTFARKRILKMERR